MNKLSRHILTPWVIGLLSIVLAGCGWQLRGAIGGGFQDVPIALAGDTDNQFFAEVSDELRNLGALMVNDRGAAQAVVVIDRAEATRATVATDADGFATEYELTYRLTFHVEAGGLGDADRFSGASQTIRNTESYPVDPNDLLAVEAEEERIEDDLRAMSIRLMLSRVSRAL